MTTLFSNISTLVNTREETKLLRGKELQHLPCLHDAFLIVEDDVVAAYGLMKDLKNKAAHFNFQQDCQGRLVLPSWCDSHTHLVFAGSREDEFVDKIKGLTYAEIAEKGGGILNTAKKVRASSEAELLKQAQNHLAEVIRSGTGAIEIKSGYGLSVDDELKILRVIRVLKQQSKALIRSTFLGAHALPAEYKNNREGYIELIINEMLPRIAAGNLADYIDVFCEEGFFTNEDTIRICEAGKAYGLISKIHANQLSATGAVQTGVQLKALSVDHLECMDDAAIGSLASSTTIGTLLPTAAFFLRQPYQPARRMIEAGCALALASDFNPGSSPSGNMNFVVALSCIQLRMLPAEVINAATINGAFAMGLQDVAGSITKGKKANLIVTKKIPSINYLPYAFASNLVEKIMLAGEWMNDSG